MKNSTKNYLTLFVTILFIIIADRSLLLYFGLPLWEWDEKLHYKHRPNVTRYWNNDKNRPIKTNEYGHHDYSFPLKKKKKELRILNLGDSITMGHGVTRDETYSKYMEEILSSSIKSFDKVEVINAGVQGYSTFQELEVLKRSLIFEPNIVTVGFCFNDVTEPFAVNKDFGGTGLDYHRVTQAPNKILSFLLNETGFGRLIQEIRAKTLDANQEKLNEIFDVQKMLENENDHQYQQQWQFTLNELKKIYSLCKEEKFEVLLLIFPFTFQLQNEKYRWAQEKVVSHAMQNGIEFINFLQILNDALQLEPSRLKELYLDEDHFTPLGHKFIAQVISDRILSMHNMNK